MSNAAKISPKLLYSFHIPNSASSVSVHLSTSQEPKGTSLKDAITRYTKSAVVAMHMTGINANALAAYRHVLRSTRIAFQGALPKHDNFKDLW